MTTAGEWKPDRLAAVSTEVALKDVDEPVQRILAGGIAGRTVVRISD
jgi:hypothetical protein